MSAAGFYPTLTPPSGSGDHGGYSPAEDSDVDEFKHGLRLGATSPSLHPIQYEEAGCYHDHQQRPILVGGHSTLAGVRWPYLPGGGDVPVGGAAWPYTSFACPASIAGTSPSASSVASYSSWCSHSAVSSCTSPCTPPTELTSPRLQFAAPFTSWTSQVDDGTYDELCFDKDIGWVLDKPLPVNAEEFGASSSLPTSPSSSCGPSAESTQPAALQSTTERFYPLCPATPQPTLPLRRPIPLRNHGGASAAVQPVRRPPVLLLLPTPSEHSGSVVPSAGHGQEPCAARRALRSTTSPTAPSCSLSPTSSAERQSAVATRSTQKAKRPPPCDTPASKKRSVRASSAADDGGGFIPAPAPAFARSDAPASDNQPGVSSSLPFDVSGGVLFRRPLGVAGHVRFECHGFAHCSWSCSNNSSNAHLHMTSHHGVDNPLFVKYSSDIMQYVSYHRQTRRHKQRRVQAASSQT